MSYLKKFVRRPNSSVMFMITLFDMSSYPISDRVARFFTEDIDYFERNWIPLCQKMGDLDRIDRFLRSKAGEHVTDYYTNFPWLNIVQKDQNANILQEKQFVLTDVTFFATNAYGWQEEYHVDDWHCKFRWIRFQKYYFRIFSFKANGVCMIKSESLRDVRCYGNPVLINSKKFVVEYDRGVPSIDHPLTYIDFADNYIETFCWQVGKQFKTKQDVMTDFNSFTVTDDVLDRMFRDVIGEAG